MTGAPSRHARGTIVGACDLGTYSGLILIVERGAQDWTVLEEEQHTVDLLGNGTPRGALPEIAIQRAERLVRRFDHLANIHNCDTAALVATAALRNAANRAAILKRLRATTTYPVRVLAARREGALAVRGALIGLPKSAMRSIVVDIGGGSTEAVRETDHGWTFRGIPWGGSKATAAWDIPGRDRAKRLLEGALHAVQGLPDWSRIGDHRLVAVGGTAVTLAAIQARHRRMNPNSIHGRVLSRRWLERTAHRLAGLNRSQIEGLIPFDPKRSRVITAGTFLWAAVLNRFGVDQVTVSARGLRWGVAAGLAESGRI